MVVETLGPPPWNDAPKTHRAVDVARAKIHSFIQIKLGLNQDSIVYCMKLKSAQYLFTMHASNNNFIFLVSAQTSWQKSTPTFFALAQVQLHSLHS